MSVEKKVLRHPRAPTERPPLAAGERLVTAVHEAGHGVAALELGCLNVRLQLHDYAGGESLRPTRTGTTPLGACRYDGEPPNLHDRLVISMAGPLAERLYTRNPDRHFLEWHDVQECQRETGRYMFTRDDPLFMGAFRAAEGLVDNRWLRILLIGGQLARKGFLQLN